jgi:TetR/AcrR family transcriptional repressor of lmrAB and yxaGH operons
MTRRSDAREKAITTAARLFDRQGYHGTGLAQIIKESGSPRGSFYFHFPDGKEQLGIEAVHAARAQGDRLISTAVSACPSDPVATVRAVGPGKYWRRFWEALAGVRLRPGPSNPLRSPKTSPICS